MSWWSEPSSTATKLGAFVVALGVVFAGAYGVGTLTGATPEPAPAMSGGHGEAGDPETADLGPGGLAVAADGFALRTVGLAPGPGEFAFQIVDDRQRPVAGFQVTHEKRLHLIVVRRDLTGFQHLHPEMDPDGTWRTPLTLPDAGAWRVFADFRPDGHDRQVILGVDVQVGGDYTPQTLPAPAAATTVDGYTVTSTGHVAAAQVSRLTLTVAKGTTPVTDLQPYLGAYGHLVALRAGDLAYLHVHPLQTHMSGPEITFDVEVPTAGSYRLFLDFQHGGVVHTAAWTATA
jgi:hypothetical protein